MLCKSVLLLQTPQAIVLQGMDVQIVLTCLEYILGFYNLQKTMNRAIALLLIVFDGSDSSSTKMAVLSMHMFKCLFKGFLL